MIEIEGIEFISKQDYFICYINEFTDQVKDLIRENLCMICNGKSAAENQKEYNNYKNTLMQLNERIKNKNDSTLKIGMVGELLVHAIFSHYFTDYQSISPFFNLEENNIKKGFDLILIKDNEVWLNEVKSGNIHKNKTQDETIAEILNYAKTDLKHRLNDGNLTLWTNAISHAKIALDKYNDEKEAVEDILSQIYVNTRDNPLQGKNMNVFLTGVLFHDIHNKFIEESVRVKKDSIIRESLFKNVIVFALQKSLCDTIIEFIIEEAK